MPWLRVGEQGVGSAHPPCRTGRSGHATALSTSPAYHRVANDFAAMQWCTIPHRSGRLRLSLSRRTAEIIGRQTVDVDPCPARADSLQHAVFEAAGSHPRTRTDKMRRADGLPIG